MLSFATEFPVGGVCQSVDFIDSIKRWILGSPHFLFSAADFSTMPAIGDWETRKGDQRIEAVLTSSTDEESTAIRTTTTADNLEWVTTIVFSRRDADGWVGIRTSVESNHPTVRLPLARKPIIVRTLLDRFSGALDGELPIKQEPHILSENDVSLAARLIDGQAGYRLPVVYVSCGFAGNYIVDAGSLAHDLGGMAHVIVEPSRLFSRRLQAEVKSENVYGGTVGVYWPSGAGRRSFFLGKGIETGPDLKRAIVDDIRTALLNRRPLLRCTWSAVQETASAAIYASLKASGSGELQKYVEAFDAEMKARAEQLDDAEQEINRLQREVRRYESQLSSNAGITLNTGSEQDFHAGELAEIVMAAVSESADRVQPDSRKEHVLRAIIESNVFGTSTTAQREELKRLLRDYKSMDRVTRTGLEAMGFSISEEGKHYKLLYYDDDRYTFTLAKSGSDHRGGLNAASDIGKRLF